MIHLYHGDGKGKTTAAMGLALRAAGSGLNVVIVQFLKGRESGEINLLGAMPNVTVLRGKNSFKFSFQMDSGERQAAAEAHEENLQEALELAYSGACDVLILDEALGALSTGLLGAELVRGLVINPLPGLELILTGRKPPEFIMDAADYITEMRCIRHPYTKGVDARRGIEW